jgi:hypothetical protein
MRRPGSRVTIRDGDPWRVTGSDLDYIVLCDWSLLLSFTDGRHLEVTDDRPSHAVKEHNDAAREREDPIAPFSCVTSIERQLVISACLWPPNCWLAGGALTATVSGPRERG